MANHNIDLTDIVETVNLETRTAKTGNAYTIMIMVVGGKTYEHMVDRAYVELLTLLNELNNK